MKSRPKLGTPLCATDHLVRVHDIRNDAGRADCTGWKRWADTYSFLDAKPVEGIYVGYRFKQEGFISYYDDEGSVWNETRRYEVWLIADTAHTAPKLVWPEDCYEV